MPKCIGSDCITLAYSIIGDYQPWINYTMKYISEMHNLDIKNDIKLISKGTGDYAET